MSTLLRRAFTSQWGGLRHEPTAKRIRARHRGITVVDSTHAVLLWEPRRIVASWAVPASDVRGELIASAEDGHRGGAGVPEGGDGVQTEHSARPVLDPSIPFTVHTAEGMTVDISVGGGSSDVLLPRAGFRLSDPDLPDYVVLSFAAFDEWLEEDEPNIGHPRDPFHRIDILDSSRKVRVELDGVLLAESDRPRLLFETMVPLRFYLPRQDVLVPLDPSATQTTCAYKGHATHYSVVAGEETHRDLAWSYLTPQREAERIAGMVAFYDERVDVILDGELRTRPLTPWSRPRP
jgi:uncharacterized protein (DUF427 family)